MRTPAAVEELEVGEERFVAPGQSDRKPLGHLVEEERLVTFGAVCAAHQLAGPRRNKHFGLEAGSGHPGRLRHLGRENAVRNEVNVGIEAGPLVAGAHLADHAVDLHFLVIRQTAFQSDYIVKLEVLAVGSDDPADSFAFAHEFPSLSTCKVQRTWDGFGIVACPREWSFATLRCRCR